MRFEPGQSGNPNGRPKGAISKDKSRFKEALTRLLEESSDQMMSWLGEIEDPKTRFDVLKDFSEYIHPKLARTESHIMGADDGAVQHELNVYINGVKPNARSED